MFDYIADPGPVHPTYIIPNKAELKTANVKARVDKGHLTIKESGSLSSKFTIARSTVQFENIYYIGKITRVYFLKTWQEHPKTVVNLSPSLFLLDIKQSLKGASWTCRTNFWKPLSQPS